jgi:hypothetical protein
MKAVTKSMEAGDRSISERFTQPDDKRGYTQGVQRLSIEDSGTTSERCRGPYGVRSEFDWD